MSNQENSDKLSQTKANLEQSKKRLEQIKAGFNNFDLTQSVNMAVINEKLNKDNSQPIQLSTAAKEFTNEPVSHKSILLDYPIKPNPRYGYGKPPNYALYNIIEKNRVVYKNTLESFLSFSHYFINIPLISNDSMEPEWNNDYLPGLDAMALYSFLALKKPKKYFEVGSGNSSKFVKKAIRDFDLQTQITSFDPHPRAEIDSLCDRVIRKPLEESDLSIFDELQSGDILFIDGSHYCFMNTDVTVVFLEILPRLKSGVLVQLHDILLPYDYPPEWTNRFYSEQYLLAAYLLAEGDKLNIVLPNAFISYDQELSGILKEIWNNPNIQGVRSTKGSSFWFEIKSPGIPK
ncbi:MAG: class I SAM-dependent methyltransferase [Microcoleus sp.]